MTTTSKEIIKTIQPEYKAQAVQNIYIITLVPVYIS